jgi:hypothetical protein
MELDSTILMPNKENPGEIYIGDVNGPYNYYHDIPDAPYECSHRLSIKWDKDSEGKPIAYHAEDLGIGIMGGWWLRAFHELKDVKLTNRVDEARSNHANQKNIELLHESPKEDIEYPYSSHSWTHTSEFTAFKKADKTLVERAETGIPLDIVNSLFITEIYSGNSIDVELVVGGESYSSRLERKKDERYKLHLNIVKDQLKLSSLEIDKDSLWFERDPDDISSFHIFTQSTNKAIAVRPKRKNKPKNTTSTGETTRRVGQDYFRREVEEEEVCHNRCIVTGVSEQKPSILIASHIKPWKDSDDDERMDGHNGLLLAPHIDKLFDKYLISFDDDGFIIQSKRLGKAVLSYWNLDTSQKYILTPKQQGYLKHHRSVMRRLDGN